MDFVKGKTCLGCNTSVANYHYNQNVLSRSSGKSPAKKVAYICRMKIREERTGQVHDYRDKESDLVACGHFVPAGNPDWSADTEKYWNELDAQEDAYIRSRFRSKEAIAKALNTAQMSLDIEFSLPKELGHEDHLEIAERFCEENFTSKGFGGDWSVHDKGDGNPHVHIVVTMRTLENGIFNKNKDRDIASKPRLLVHRKSCEVLQNEYLKKRGFEERVSCLNYKAQGIDISPTKHEGYWARALEKLGVKSRIVAENKEIQQHNIELMYESPEEVLKVVGHKKAFFTKHDVAFELFKRAGGEIEVFADLKRRAEQELGIGSGNYLKNSNALVDSLLDHQYQLYEKSGEMADKVLASEVVVNLGKDLKDQESYTTKETLEREQRCVELIKTLNSRSTKAVDERIVNLFVTQASKGDFELNTQQEAAVRHLTSGPDIRSLVGRAGTGKTTSLKPIAQAYKKAGYKLRCMALQGIAAEVMEQEIGAPASTIDKWLERKRQYERLESDLKAGKYRGKGLEKAEAKAKSRLRDLKAWQIDDRTVILLDEANMISTSRWLPVLEQAVERGAKVLVVQDPNQLKSLEGGDIGQAVLDHVDSVQLTEVMRQRVRWQKTASEILNAHDIRGGMQLYKDKGHLSWYQSLEETKYRIVEDYMRDLAANPKETAVVLAYRNQDVTDINHQIRENLKSQGQLTETVLIGGKEFAVGDKVVFLSNDNEAKFVKAKNWSGKNVRVKNGTVGILTEIAGDKVSVDIDYKDNGISRVFFNKDTYRNIDHGYAVTIHKSEGTTVDRAHVLYDTLMGAHSTTVAMTRHRKDVRGYIAMDRIKDFAELTNTLGRVEPKQNIYQIFNPDQNSQDWNKQAVKRFYQLTQQASTKYQTIIQTLTPEMTLSQAPGYEEYAEVRENRNALALKISEDFDGCEPYLKNIGISKERVEQFAGLKPYQPSSLNHKHQQAVEEYVYLVSETRKLWQHIASSQDHKLSYEAHPQYQQFKALQAERNSSANVLFETHTISRNLLVSAAHQEGINISWRGVIKHAKSHLKDQQQLAYEYHLDPDDKVLFNTLKTYHQARTLAAETYRHIKDNDYKPHTQPTIYQDFYETKHLRDQLAHSVTTDKAFNNAEKHMEILGIKEELLHKHAAQYEQHLETSQKLSTETLGTSPQLKPLQSRKQYYNYDAIMDQLSLRAAEITRSLLGNENPSLSTSTTLKYGRKGSLSIKTQGPDAGLWYDFEAGEGGHLFDLIARKADTKSPLQSHSNLSFVETMKHANDLLGGGMVQEETAEFINTVSAKLQANKQEAQQQVDTQKIKEAQDKYQKSLPAKGTIVETYLRNRGIKTHDPKDYPIPDDLRYLEFARKDPETGRWYPAMVAFTRDKDGTITGYQATAIDPDTGLKADISPAKLSHGKISSSAVILQKADPNSTDSTYIAEGIETALSVRDAGVRGTILVSLGISNIKKVPIKDGSPVIICADHDPKDSAAHKTIEKAQQALESRHESVVTEVKVIKPRDEGTDFNDTLRYKCMAALKQELQGQDITLTRPIPEAWMEKEFTADHTPTEAKEAKLKANAAAKRTGLGAGGKSPKNQASIEKDDGFDLGM